jgi:hypothetical protein
MIRQIGKRQSAPCGQGMLEGVLGVCLLVGIAAMDRYYPAARPDDFQQNDPQKTELERQVRQLGHEVQQLQREQAMPVVVLHRYRNSICYISGIYHVGYAGHQPEFRARISGTSFVVSDRLIATNRHVAEPWYEDSQPGVLIRRGAEPEIYLPPGTDLRVGLKDNVDLPEELVPPPPLPGLQNDEQQSVAAVLDQLPTRTLDKKSHEADLINMAFIGTREELAQAFQGAGWKQSDSVSWQSVKLQFHAFLAKSSYATAPMSEQLFDGHPPDLTLEKTFDSYGRRDHLRIWKLESTVDDVPLWVGSAVRETGATFSVARMGFVHHVSDDLEGEQRAIERHLLAADCIDSVGKVERPGMDKAVINATGEVLRTDGSVMVLRVKVCSAPSSPDFNDATRFRPRSKFSRYLRKEILTVRSDLLRANSIYALFCVTVATTKTLRHMSARRADIRSTHIASARLPASGPESHQVPVDPQSSGIESWPARF